MTTPAMSRLSQTLVTFKQKIEEAVALVPPMTAEDKLKAVQYWNVVSERLQEIVNNSAPEINALALLSEQQEEQQSLAPTQRHNESRSPQPTVPLMERIGAIDGSSNDKQELYLPIMSHSNSHQTVVNDNSLISNTNSNHMPPQDYHQNGVSVESEEEAIDEHMASVITSYPNSVQSQQQMYATYSEQKESPELYDQMSRTPNHMHSHLLTTPGMSATTSVIQEVDPNVMTSQRRNVIQSTQRAIEAIEKNLKNCCNDFENNNQMNANRSDNTCDETIDDYNYNTMNNTNNSNENSNIIKIIDTDESLAESSINNQVFNETSFDVSSYASSEDIEQQKSFKIDESLNDSSDAKDLTNDSKANDNKKKSKSVINSKNKNSAAKSEPNGNTDIECNVCHKTFPNNSALVSHQWIHSKPYTCDYEECSARFSTKGNLLVHQRRHTGEKPFTCSHEGCAASFSTKGNLKRHIKAHSGERPWKCSQCDSRFTEKKSLKVHMRRHTGEKPYVCQICDKSFSQTGVLQTHMALHLDERKHLCELCGKAFRQRSQLRLHVLRHEGVKRWDCSDCDAKFLTKGDLERHHRVHTGERPFVCDQCGKTFTRQQSLNEHTNRHLGRKPYSCTHCSKTFAEMSACYKHIKVHKRQSDKNKANATVVDNSHRTNEINAIDMKNTRSQVNVIQSTASSAEHTNVLYGNGNRSNGSIEDSVISDNSSINESYNNQRLEYVEFGAINVLAKASTQQMV